MITAVEPWSGHYSVDDKDLAVVYATAHVTQFTDVGWHYLPVGAGSGSLPGAHAADSVAQQLSRRQKRDSRPRPR